MSNARLGCNVVYGREKLRAGAGAAGGVIYQLEQPGALSREVLTAPLVRQLYNVEADVSFHEAAGHLTVVPIRRTP